MTLGDQYIDAIETGAHIDSRMSAPRLPKKLYRVTRNGGNLRYLSKQGKTFADLVSAREHAAAIRRDGATARIFECEPEWHEIPTHHEPVAP